MIVTKHVFSWFHILLSLFDENKNKITKIGQKFVITQAFSWFHILSLFDKLNIK